MRAAALLLSAILVLAPFASALAQDAPPRPAAGEAAGIEMSPQQRESLQKLTALLIITLVVLLIMVVVFVVISITLRRRLVSLEERQMNAATQLEDLWWKMEGPNPFDEEEKKE